MAGRSDVPNDRQHVGSELRFLRLTGRAYALHGAGGVGRAQPLSARLGGRQSRTLYTAFPIDPETTRVSSYGWSLETRHLLRDRYNRCII
jgi:hypothetical protein